MKTRIGAMVLALAVALCLLPASARAAEEIPAKSTQSNGRPYYIMVNRRMSTVTVYTADENGFYTIPVRAMVCSTGSAQHATPKGNFSIGNKHRWNLMMGGVYAQYLSQFYKDCLFHSVCYSRPSPDTLLPGYYNNLGNPASHGCVRLQTEDAKWIYENCDQGTLVTIYDGDEPGELGKPDKMIDSLPSKTAWDPTDPEPENPWADRWTTDISLSADSIRLLPGAGAVLGVERFPEGSSYPTAMFRTDNPSVAVVDGAGRIRATGIGRTIVTVACGGAEKRCEILVADTELPFIDVFSDMWFYPHVRYLHENGLISCGEDYRFAPDAPLLRTEALHLLYTAAGSPSVAQMGNGRAWFADALDWADAAGLLESGGSGLTLSKGDFIELLYRYDALRRGVELSAADVLSAAVDWAIRADVLLGGGDGELALDATITRAQMAALLHRYCRL